MQDKPISNDTFIEWTKDIFKNSTGPKKLLVYSVETKQWFVDRGVPEEYIDVIGPLKHKRRKAR